MQTPIFSRPVLPPSHYALFLPWRGLYLRAIDAAAGRFKTTADPRRACELSDSIARATGLMLVRATGEPVELRRLTQMNCPSSRTYGRPRQAARGAA